MRRRYLFVPASLFVASCVQKHPTTLPGCAGGAGGPLRILPSQVAGVSVDSASWKVVMESPEMSTKTTLYYFAWLSTDRPAPLDSLAVAFHSARAADDSLLLVGGWRIPKPAAAVMVFTYGRDVLLPHEPRTAMRALSVPGSAPGQWACPASVQIVRSERTGRW